MLVKAVIIIFLLVILYSLGSSFIFMIRDKGQGERALHRLMWRIGLSIFLLILLYVMFQLGWIESSGGPIRYGAGG
ncbi:DUF2909 domain-containing protein [Pseudomonadota bacterium]